MAPPTKTFNAFISNSLAKKRLKLVPFLIIKEALPHPSGRETFSLPDFHIFCTAATKFTLLPLHSFLYRLFETPGGIAFQVRHL